MNTELKRKHRLKRELKKDIDRKCKEIRDSTSFVFLNALRYRIRMKVTNKLRKWRSTHAKKLRDLRGSIFPLPARIATTSTPRPNVVHNFSSYALTEKEHEVLSYSLDHYIPGKEYGKRAEVEFERFYQSILNTTEHLKHLSERERVKLKSCFLETYTKYTSVRVSGEHKNILERLYRNRDIAILKQDKGRGVVLLNRNEYVSKAEEFLNGSEFIKLDEDPTRSFQSYVQRTLLSMKNCFDERIYQKIYPSSSRPGLYFGLAKVHKLRNLPINSEERGVPLEPNDRSNAAQELPLRPVISNIGTATYELSKYLAQILKPLTKSDYSIESTGDFINRLRNKRIPEGHKLVSFDVVSLFTKVPLDFTINLILNKVYRDKRIRTKLKREQLKKLLEICTKEMHFSYNGTIYQQIDGVAMGSPLGPVLANVFMVELESIMVPRLSNDVPLWLRYVDDTFSFVKQEKVEEVISALNGFHPNIKFTSECEVNGSISFLDVKVTKLPNGCFATDVYRKTTDTNIYMNWKSFAPKSWKIGTLKGLIRRAFIVCSSDESRRKEISFLKKVFVDINCFPSRVVYNTVQQVQRKIEQENSPAPNVTTASESVSDEGTNVTISKPFISLPYKGKEGEKIISQFRKALDKALPNNVQPQFVYTGQKVGSLFRIKDKVPIQHESNCVYAFKESGTTRYIGETSVRFGERIHEHQNTDKKSSVYKYIRQNNVDTSQDNFEIIDSGYPNKINRKLAESLHIKEVNPELNERGSSYKLCLFN